MRAFDRLVVGMLAQLYRVLRSSSGAIEGIALRRVERWVETGDTGGCRSCTKRAIRLLKRIEERYGERT